MGLQRRICARPLAGIAATFLLVFGSLITLAAQDPLDQVRQLRDQGQYDRALEALQKLSVDMSITKEVRAVLDYENGVTLIEKSRAVRDTMSRMGLLAEAQTALETFVSKHGTHPLASSARSQLGMIFVENAKLRVEQSKRSDTPEEKERNLTAARDQYAQAQRVFSAGLKATRAELEKIGVALDPKTDRKHIELRDRLRADYLQTRLLIPSVKEQHAGTYGEDALVRRELLQSAADDFSKVYEDYRTRLAGLYGRMYQGRCLAKLGEHGKALECFNNLLDQPDAPEVFKQLKLRAALLAADCWLDAKRESYKRAIDVMQRLMDKSNAHELRQKDWLLLRVNLARAYKLQADQLAEAADRSDDEEMQRKQSVSKALVHARSAAEIPGDHTKQARALVAEITGMSEPKNLDQAKPRDEAAEEDIKTFDDAFRAGRDSLKKIQVAQARGDKAALRESQREAIRFLKLALDSVEADTPIEDVNVTRFYLCYVYYASGDFEKAAEVGEFLARRFPKDSAAPQAAKIAMASHLNQYKQAAVKEKRAASARLTSICRHIIETWPNNPIAAEAAQTLIMFALLNDKLDEAIANLKLVPEDARKRGDLELQLGQALWRAGLIELRKKGEGDPDKLDEEFVKSREQAKQFLESGIRRSTFDPKDATATRHLVTGALSLSQIYVHEKAFDKAVALLEDKTIGPHTLMTAKNPAVAIPGFDVHTYTVATRAYRGIVEFDKSDAETQKEAERKLKRAIVDLDRARAVSGGGRIELDLTPPESDLPKRRD